MANKNAIDDNKDLDEMLSFLNEDELETSLDYQQGISEVSRNLSRLHGIKL